MKTTAANNVFGSWPIAYSTKLRSECVPNRRVIPPTMSKCHTRTETRRRPLKRLPSKTCDLVGFPCCRHEGTYPERTRRRICWRWTPGRSRCRLDCCSERCWEMRREDWTARFLCGKHKHRWTKPRWSRSRKAFKGGLSDNVW